MSEPEPFRYRIGAYVQAARSVTFMLQKEHAVFADIGWYARWARYRIVRTVLRDGREVWEHEPPEAHAHHVLQRADDLMT